MSIDMEEMVRAHVEIATSVADVLGLSDDENKASFAPQMVFHTKKGEDAGRVRVIGFELPQDQRKRFEAMMLMGRDTAKAIMKEGEQVEAIFLTLEGYARLLNSLQFEQYRRNKDVEVAKQEVLVCTGQHRNGTMVMGKVPILRSTSGEAMFGKAEIDKARKREGKEYTGLLDYAWEGVRSCEQ